jgi:hypothetical protein
MRMLLVDFGERRLLSGRGVEFKLLVCLGRRKIERG